MATTAELAAPFVGTNPNLTANKNYVNAVYQYANKTAAPQSVLDQWTGKTVADVTKGIWGESTGSWKYVSGLWGTNFGYGVTPPVQTTDQARQNVPPPVPAAPVPQAPAPAPLFDPAKLLNSAPAPQAPDLVALYAQMRATYGVDAAQAALDAAQKEINDLDAAFMAGNHQTGNELAPMQIIRGEKQLLNEQYQEKRFIAANLLTAAQNNVRNKQDMVSFMMDLTDKNYDNAKAAYDTAFTQNMQVQEFLYSAKKDERDYARLISNDAADRAYQQQTMQMEIDKQQRSDAQANLTTLTNMIVDSGKSWKDVDASMKAKINQLEIQAGLPAGTIGAFYASKPAAKLLAQVEDGNGNVTFIYANPDGTPGMVKTVKGVGKVSSNGGGGGAPSTTEGNPWDMVKPVSGVSVNHTSGSGYSFEGLVGTGKTAVKQGITMGQYAAAKKTNILTLLNDGSEGDKATAKNLQADIADFQDNKDSLATFTAYLYDTYGWLFEGTTPTQVQTITGYTPKK